MKDNEKIKIDEALSHIKKAIIETDDIESKNVNKNDYILLDKIVTNKNEKVIDKKKLGIKKHKKKNILEKNKKKSSPNKKKEIKSKLIKKNKEKSPVDDLVDKEVKPIIKKWRATSVYLAPCLSYSSIDSKFNHIYVIVNCYSI